MKNHLLPTLLGLTLIVATNAQIPGDSGLPDGSSLRFMNARNSGSYAMMFHGAVHIGHAPDHPDYKAEGHASKRLFEEGNNLVIQGGAWVEDITFQHSENWNYPDYVFEKDYDLPSLEELEKYLIQNKHLPGVANEEEVKENGLNSVQMHLVLLKKVEELTLYTIEQHKEIKAYNELNNTLLNRIERLESVVKRLEGNK